MDSGREVITNVMKLKWNVSIDCVLVGQRNGNSYHWLSLGPRLSQVDITTRIQRRVRTVAKIVLWVNLPQPFLSQGSYGCFSFVRTEYEEYLSCKKWGGVYYLLLQFLLGFYQGLRGRVLMFLSKSYLLPWEGWGAKLVEVNHHQIVS